MSARTIRVRRCAPGTYTCAHFDCGQEAEIVEHVAFERPGGTQGLAFYGICSHHLVERCAERLAAMSLNLEEK